MLCDQRLKDIFATLLERGQCARLITLHEAAVADHIGGQDGGKAALGAFFGHVRMLKRTASSHNLPIEQKGYMNSA
jgi:hypothetical protein